MDTQEKNRDSGDADGAMERYQALQRYADSDLPASDEAAALLDTLGITNTEHE